jgi:plastocyanin
MKARLLITAAIIGTLALSACSDDDNNPTSPNPNPNPNPRPGLELDSGNIAPGGFFEHTFDSVGTFPYACNVHTTETGSITVTEMPDTLSDSAMVIVTINDSTVVDSIGVPGGFFPQTVTIGNGGTVRWNNTSSSVHTVTTVNAGSQSIYRRRGL